MIRSLRLGPPISCQNINEGTTAETEMRERERERRETDKQTETDRQTDRQTNRQRQTDRQTDRQAEGGREIMNTAGLIDFNQTCGTISNIETIRFYLAGGKKQKYLTLPLFIYHLIEQHL